MTAKELFNDIREYCIRNADEAVVVKYSRYFREGYDAYGLSQKMVEDKAKLILADKTITIKLIAETCRLLIKTGKYEEVSFAYLLLLSFRKTFTSDTFSEIQIWFETGINNWAHTDITCSYLLFPLLHKGIIGVNSFDLWRKAKNKYQRRAVPVSLIKLLKTTDDFKPLFLFVEPLMRDPDRVVHQGVGWFIREAWKINKPETEVFLMKWKDTAPRLIFQYACEKMSAEEKLKFKRDKALKKTTDDNY